MVVNPFYLPSGKPSMEFTHMLTRRGPQDETSKVTITGDLSFTFAFEFLIPMYLSKTYEGCP